jgi:hypothetical protein
MRATITDMLISRKERAMQRLQFFQNNSADVDQIKKSSRLFRKTIMYIIYSLMFTVMIILQLDNETVIKCYIILYSHKWSLSQ